MAIRASSIRHVPIGPARQLLLSGRNVTRSFAASQRRQNDGPQAHQDAKIDVEEMYGQPSWSIAALLPPKEYSADSPTITSKQLHHLLRLSALPPPGSAEEEVQMLSTLQSQLHFVREIQKVDTTDVEPLRSFRDETPEGDRQSVLGLDALKEALGNEEVKGTYHKRIRRKRNLPGSAKNEEWDVLGNAQRKVGRYFVVEGGKE